MINLWSGSNQLSNVKRGCKTDGSCASHSSPQSMRLCTDLSQSKRGAPGSSQRGTPGAVSTIKARSSEDISCSIRCRQERQLVEDNKHLLRPSSHPELRTSALPLHGADETAAKTSPAEDARKAGPSHFAVRKAVVGIIRTANYIAAPTAAKSKTPKRVLASEETKTGSAVRKSETAKTVKQKKAETGGSDALKETTI